ncbi:deoxyhypusine synthase [Candidatus Woesearchaeota archaeon]|nr:deoxyhypusine synthase [Candidatus Woesearchaeota archaeon]
MDNPSFKRDIKDKSIREGTMLEIKGFDAASDVGLKDLPGLYKKIGFQATHLGQAAEIIGKMKGSAIFLACTSNIVSSGLREMIAQLVREKKIVALITSTGAIEEDWMKSQKPFLAGDFNADDVQLKENGMNRIGNIFVPDEYYGRLEDFHMGFIAEMMAKKRIWTPSEYVREIGLRMDDENSILYWAAKNNIPIFCPGFVDGAIGDHFFFYNQNKPTEEKIVIDQAGDVERFYKMILAPEKISAIILGGGIAKHHLIGASIIRDGLDYAVYVQTGTEGDGSLSGAKPKEAVSWNKLKEGKNSVCIEADATLVFPILAAGLLE